MGKLLNEFIEAFDKENHYLYDFTTLEADFEAALDGYDDSLYSLRDYFLNGIKAKKNLNLATFFNEKIIEIKQQAFDQGKLNCVFLLYDGFYTRALIEGLRFDEGLSTFEKVKDLHLYGINFMFTHINAKEWNSALIDNLRELTLKERIKHDQALH
ncbi:hypothetical protein GVN20_28890 [Runella sp. CRIBMP]|nr:hypothetical protein [Runella sp. CRIBMP]